MSKINNHNPSEIITSFSKTMAKNNLSRISYKDDKIEVTLESTLPVTGAVMQPETYPVTYTTPQPQPAPVQTSPTQPAAPTAEQSVVPTNTDELMIKSPTIGVIYEASKPGADPFIKVGDRITKGQTLFIIECMKTMNPVKSEHEGIVKEILVKNGTPVEYDQRLVVISKE